MLTLAVGLPSVVFPSVSYLSLSFFLSSLQVVSLVDLLPPPFPSPFHPVVVYRCFYMHPELEPLLHLPHRCHHPLIQCISDMKKFKREVRPKEVVPRYRRTSPVLANMTINKN